MKNKYKNKLAFTLIEVLLAMTITSIIVLAIHGAYRQGSMMWNRSEADAQAYHQINTLTEMLRTEIGSIYLQEPAKKQQDESEQSSDDAKTEYNFILSNSQISFYTLNPSHNTSHRYGRISKVSYLIEANEETGLITLKRTELLAAGGKVIEIQDGDTNKIDTLSSDIFNELAFEAYIQDPETKKHSWKKVFQSNDSIPKAIAIIIHKPETRYTQSYETKLVINTVSEAN